LEFEGLDELDNLLLLGLALIPFILLIFSHKALVHYKKECISRKQTEQRLRDCLFDLRMRVKYQNDDINNMFTAQKEIEHKFEIMFDISPDIMCIFDLNCSIIDVNSCFARMLCFDKENVIHKAFLDFVHADDREMTRIELVGIAKSGLFSAFQNRYICKDSSYKSLRWVIAFVPEQKIYLAAATDLTGQRKIEDMTVMLNEALNYERVKAEFFANLSHELKTPLSVLISTLQLLRLIIFSEQTESSNTNIQRYLNIMKQNCFRLLRLVNNMIDVARIDSGFINLQLGNHNIVSIVEDVCMSVADYVKTRNINFVFDTEIEEMTIACDPDKIEKIILNILSNAVKFTDQGGLVSVNIYCDNKNITTSVKDTGIGIPQDKLETIFERYKQLDKTLPRNYGGSGIGLSLVKSLVEMHNGKVWVKSAENKGAEFCVSLPIRILEREKPKSEKENGYAQQDRVEKITIEFSDIYIN